MKFFFLALLVLPASLFCQRIGTFNSIQPTAQTPTLVLPSTHTFQKIIRTGDALPSGGVLGANLDFTGYVPIAGSSTQGYLSISSETTPAECAILSLSFNASTKTWSYTDGGKVDFPVAEIGNVSRFCSGTVTPDNTIMVGEESVSGGDANADGYEDIGWLMEIDPVTRTVINHDGVAGADKLWAAGRQAHENVSIKSDKSVLYWGADASPTGYMYKFVPSAPGDYTSGALYVLQTTASFGTGTWVQVNNTTQSDRNNTAGLSTALGAYNFDGIEDVELGPDNKVYFAAKGPGVIYRFRDLGATVDQLEVYVSSVNYDVDGAGPYTPEPWGTGNDNLAFDGEGNLWVLQDGSRNHIWVIGPGHSASSVAVRLFATTPLGSEPTGITFTPDYKYMFITFQHPAGGNTIAQTDAADVPVIFNTHTTVVIARKENLGSSSLPLKFLSFNIQQQAQGVALKWTVSEISNHQYFDIERSVDGIHFDNIGRVNDNINHRQQASLSFRDEEVPMAEKIYYRLKQCDNDGHCSFSGTKWIRGESTQKIALFPLPAGQTLHVQFAATETENISLLVVNASGNMVRKESRRATKGWNNLNMSTGELPPGQYFLFITSSNRKKVAAFTKSR